MFSDFLPFEKRKLNCTELNMSTYNYVKLVSLYSHASSLFFQIKCSCRVQDTTKKGRILVQCHRFSISYLRGVPVQLRGQYLESTGHWWNPIESRSIEIVVEEKHPSEKVTH